MHTTSTSTRPASTYACLTTLLANSVTTTAAADKSTPGHSRVRTSTTSCRIHGTTAGRTSNSKRHRFPPTASTLPAFPPIKTD
jgi:hypothetical protein